MLKLIIDGINPDGYAVQCDSCESSTANLCGQLPTREQAQQLADAIDFVTTEERHTCPACRVSGVAR